MAAPKEPQVLRIKDFQNAVADSPLLGHGQLKNIDIDTVPGAMKVGKAPLTMIQSIISAGATFTADAATNICTAASNLRTQGEIDKGNNFYYAPVYFTTTNTLPAGLSTGTVYFLIYLTDTTFKVASTWANADSATAIDITDAGTGVHTIHPVPIGTFRHIVRDPRTDYKFATDSNGRTWNTRGGNEFYLLLNAALDNGSSALTAREGQGIALFRTSDGTKTWLFYFGNALVDYINVYGNTELNADAWTNGWKSLNSGAGSGNPHMTKLGQDNIIYFCDDRYVGSLLEVPGQVLDPTNAATYTFNNQALDMPQGEITDWLEELGTNLLVAGQNYNYIYPWDRISDSYNLPLAVPEKAIYRLKNLGSTVYILAGSRGNIYTTQGTYVKFFKKIPEYITNNGSSLSSNPITWGGISICEGAIIFGVGFTASGLGGIFKLYQDGRLLQDQTPYGGAQNVTAIYADTQFYFFGYAGGADYSDSHNYSNGSYGAVYQSAIYVVGNKTHKAQYSEIEVQTTKPASSGNIRLKYRTNITASFSDFPGGAVVFSGNSSDLSYNADIGLTDLENCQIQAEFDGNIDIMEIRLIP